MLCRTEGRTVPPIFLTAVQKFLKPIIDTEVGRIVIGFLHELGTEAVVRKGPLLNT